MDYYIATSTCAGDTCVYHIPSQIVGDIVFPLFTLIFFSALIACGMIFSVMFGRRR